MAALSDLVERVLRRQEFGNAADECETLARQERRGTILAVEPFQVRLVLEKFQLAWRPGHMQIDDAPHFGSKLRRQRSKRAGWLAREVEMMLRLPVFWNALWYDGSASKLLTPPPPLLQAVSPR